MSAPICQITYARYKILQQTFYTGTRYPSIPVYTQPDSSGIIGNSEGARFPEFMQNAYLQDV